MGYRVRQFALAVGAAINPEHADSLKEYLQGPQLELFRGMSSIDRHHCSAVFRFLREAGETDESLLQAALLHDVGKTMGPVRIWHRVIAVLAKAFAPQLYERMDGRPESWSYPLYVHRQHAVLGAEMARRAHCEPEVVWLIAHHEDTPDEIKSPGRKNTLLAALRAADAAN